MRHAVEQQKERRTLLLAAPALAWIVLFFALPIVCIVSVSFFTNGTYGELERPFTLESYKRFLGFGVFGWEPLYPIIIGRTLLAAGGTTLACLVLGLPLVFWIASLPARWKTFALTLVVIPLWTNLLIRTYAWQLLLGHTSLYPGPVAVGLGLICDYLPFLVLPLYASVEKIDWSLAEAARDLGASHWNVFRHGLVPQIAPGLSAGLVLVFVPATGQFVIPDLLGGSKTVLMGNLIQQQYGASRDWPFGSALATIGMLIVLLVLWMQARIAKQKEVLP